ncbi:MAG: [LysW]-aminoadipate/[LysW]-glutamate kinase [Candidatus Bathyarchaeia archaeon]
MLVLKIGGSTLAEGISPDFFKDLKEVHKMANRIVLVHGGGKEVTEIANKLGKEQKFIVSPEGFRSRYTDKETAEVYTMVMAGKINKFLVSTLLSHGMIAIGLSGLDGELAKAERKKRLVIIDERGRKRIIDGGYTGRITKINDDLLYMLLEKGYLPVVAPVAISEEYEPLNVDGDRMAAYIAGSIKADKLIFFTNVKGLILNGKKIDRLSVEEAKEMLPKIGHGMITKVYAAMEAIEMGVKETIITTGLEPFPISSSLEGKLGTVISNE